ncbi:MAG TPA: class I SAM-dependent methyltransferase [Candidatus Sulfotelmatobacter sp.]|nr:class I SAM-dependent methyltransferase [Candidatus Sulfotelmatobacter sp.]
MSDSMQMSNADRRYLPAAGRDAFLPFYDFIARLLGADKARRSLLQHAKLMPNERILDIGCGTGTFAVMAKQFYPSVDIVGLDPDPKALARASQKAEKARVSLRFDRGFADSLGYPTDTFDSVFSSFMFHHLESSNREKTLREVVRVLKPGGRFLLLDFEASDSGHGLMDLFHRTERLHDNSEDRILALMRQGGFSAYGKLESIPVFWGLGRAGLYQATK